MRIPVQNEKLTSADGVVYLVEKVDVVDKSFWLVDIVEAAVADEMDAFSEQYNPEEFVFFCQDNGILYR